MSYNGSGTFNINTAGQPVVTGTVISSSVFNALTADLATGLSTAITKDGQTTITANIPMNSYKFTGLAAGTAATDSVRLGQVQAGSATVITVTGTDTYTGTMSPALSAYAAGQMFTFTVSGTNTTACTINIDGLGAKSITRDGSTALVAGDLVLNSQVIIVYDGVRFQVVNSNSKTNFNLSGTLTVAGNTTLSGGTANGVAYLNGSKVLTTGSALVFDGTNLGVGTSSPTQKLDVNGAANVLQGAAYGWQVKNSGAIRSGSNGVLQISADTANAYASSQISFDIDGNVVGTWDSSGNLGLGVTPSAWSSTFRAFQIARSSFWTPASGGSTYIDTNAFFDSVGYKYIANGFATEYAQVTDGSHRWYTAPSGTAGNAISFTQAMTLDASGNLVVGGTSAVITGAGRGNITINGSSTAIMALSVGGTAKGSFYHGGTNLEIINYHSGGNLDFYVNGDYRARIDSSGSLLVGATTGYSGFKVQTVNGNGFSVQNSAGTAQAAWFGAGGSVGLSSGNYAVINGVSGILLGVNSTEAARIDAASNLLVGTATAGAGVGYAVRLAVDGGGAEAGIFKTSAGTSAYPCVMWNTATTGDNLFVLFGTEGTITTRGSITYNRAGGAVAYNTTSDYRAKDIIGPVQNSGAAIDALKVYMGKMKGATLERPMLIAHEAQEIAPYCVTGEKDAVNNDGTPKYQQMDVSALVPLLLAEIQSLRARVAQLESK